MKKFLKILFLWKSWSDFEISLQKYSLYDPFQKLVVNVDSSKNNTLLLAPACGAFVWLILDSSKLKGFFRQQIQIWRKWQKAIQTGSKHCGKRRNCSLRAISPFPTVFSKGLFPWGPMFLATIGHLLFFKKLSLGTYPKIYLLNSDS